MHKIIATYSLLYLLHGEKRKENIAKPGTNVSFAKYVVNGIKKIENK